MKQRRNDMRKAFEQLQVNRPLRLPGEGPGLVPPQNRIEQIEVPPMEVPLTQVAIPEAPRKQLPPKERASFEDAAFEVTQFEQAHEKIPQSELASRPGADRNAKAKTSAHVREHTQSNSKQTEGSQNEHTEKEKPQLQVTHSEVPDYEEPQEREPSAAAFFRLSPRVFSEAVTRNMSGDCFRLFLWLSWRAWRFPNSPGVVRAAVSFIELETGMGHATVSRCLKTLKELNLVTLVETNFKRGNVWKVSSLACPGRVPDPGPGARQPKKGAPRSEVAAAFKTGNHSLKPSNEHPQSELHIKNYKNLRKPLCRATRVLFERLDRIEAPKKRAREAASLEALLENFAPDVLLRAIEFVEKKGTLKGEPCHSPFAYLTMAADDVLKRLSANGGSDRAIALVEVRPEAPRIETTLALESFQQELSPPERDQFLESFIRAEFPHGFLPPRRVTESLAAAAWMASGRSASILGLAG